MRCINDSSSQCGSSGHYCPYSPIENQHKCIAYQPKFASVKEEMEHEVKQAREVQEWKRKENGEK